MNRSLNLCPAVMNHQISSEELAVKWTRAQRQVEAFILSFVPDFNQADDILQNVAMVVVRKRSEYDPTRPFMPWVIQIAKFEVLKHRRTRARDRHQFKESLVDQIEQAHLREIPELAETRRLVAECIKKVKGRAHKALLLRYVDNLKPSEVAKRLCVAGGAARMILMRARNVVRQCVEQGLGRQGKS